MKLNLIKNKTEEQAVVLCGHGSRDNNYLRELIEFEEKLKQKLSKIKIFHCFIEINSPGIEECLKSLSNRFTKIFFFPLLLFEGKHMIQDIRKKISNFKGSEKNKIILIEKLSLINDILPIMLKNPEFETKYDTIITSCSTSKNPNVIKELEIYTSKLSSRLGITNRIFHFVGDESLVYEALKKKNCRSQNIILHPIFFFNGFLYRKNIETIKQFFKITVIKPLNYNESIISIVSKKISELL